MVSRQSQAVVNHAVQPAKPSRSMPAQRRASNHKMGNQAAQRLLRDGVIQAKLTVNQPGDRFEQEADRMADNVMRMPDPQGTRRQPQIQRLCAKCEVDLHRVELDQDEDTIVQAKSTPGYTHELSPEIATYIEGRRSGGQPLPSSVRTFFEPRFGHDLSRVRVHTDTVAARTARAVDARAYTIGQSIVFGAGEFRPETHEGRALLAHEITHTLQQEQGSPNSGQQVQRTIGDGHDLQASRFKGNTLLEAAFDQGDRVVIEKPDNGPHVKLLQQSLLAMGYALPAFGADGDFGDETKAAILQFQRDVPAMDIDGIVGPETMELFDQHDPTRPGGVGPPQRTGPVPSPLPPPAAGCDSRYTGVHFTMGNQQASDETNAAEFVITNRFRRGRALDINGKAPAKYAPNVTITAPTNAKAQEFEVGFVSNVMMHQREYTYSNGVRLYSTVSTPIKDGASGTKYDPVYAIATPTASQTEDFMRNLQTISLIWKDKPMDYAFLRPQGNNYPGCRNQPAGGRMTDAIVQDYFRTWVVARHKASGCTLPLHHIDWNTDWRAEVHDVGGTPTVNVLSKNIAVTEKNGDGKPRFIQGGPVFNELVKTSRTCA